MVWGQEVPGQGARGLQCGLPSPPARPERPWAGLCGCALPLPTAAEIQGRSFLSRVTAHFLALTDPIFHGQAPPPPPSVQNTPALRTSLTQAIHSRF